MFRYLGIIYFILLAGISAFLTDATYCLASDIKVPIVYAINQPVSYMQQASFDYDSAEPLFDSSGSVQQASFNYDPSMPTFDSVHVWPNSKCGFCHLAEDPNVEPMLFVASDQSLLCKSCHPSTVTVLSNNGFSKETHALDNHPIKFSPFDFDPDKINRNIILKNGTFYLSGVAGKVPLFGDTEDTAVAECSTCHDPHGRTNVPLLGRLDNTKGELCIVCHINISVEKT